MVCKESRSAVVLGDAKKKLEGKTVAVIGVGGTGSTLANLLARQGIGKLILIDDDIVEETNIERQILYDKEDVGKLKAAAAMSKLKPFSYTVARIERIDSDNVEIIGHPDLIIDCTDNTAARLAIDDYARENKIPWLYTGAVGKIGAIYLVRPDGPSFRDFNGDKEGQKCAEIGVMNSTVTLISSLAASVATDYLALEKIEKDMIRINLETNTFLKIKVNRLDQN